MSPGCLVVIRLAEAFLLDAVLDIETVSSTALVTNEKLPASLVKAHACDICMADITEHIL